MRLCCVIVGIAILISSGCCGPYGCGFGCRALEGCYDCEGGFGPPTIPHGPIEGLRQARRSLVCGRGCGEVYYGEWMSTPPDCSDPCCGDQFVGGAVRCTPFCYEPGTLLRRLYGQRFCECCQNWADDCCCSGEGYLSGDEYLGIASESSDPGCNCGGHHGPIHSEGPAIEYGVPQKDQPSTTPTSRNVRMVRSPQTVSSQREPAMNGNVPASRMRSQPVVR